MIGALVSYHHCMFADQGEFQSTSARLLQTIIMKGRQQEGSSEPASTQQSGSATVASADLVASIPRERQPLDTKDATSKSQKPSKQKPICRFYMSSSCKYGARCKFYHPKPSQLNPANKSGENYDERSTETSSAAGSRRTPSDLNLGMFMKRVKLRPPVRRPEPANKTPTDLLKVELEQLAVRFPGDQSKVIEVGKRGVMYRIVFSPTDPDWIFSFKTVDLLVDIPNEYPLKPLSVIVPDDQPIPKECSSSINSAIVEWVSSHSSGSLMLRPFLQWLDRVITALVQDSLPEDGAIAVAQTPPLEDVEKSDDSPITSEDVQIIDEQEGKEGSELKALAAKRGTEVRLKDLALGQYVGTVLFPNFKLVVDCTRCKISQDITITAENCVSKSCLRCHACMSATFHPTLIYAGSITMGYMDLLGCAAVDVVLMDSNVTITCLECGRENTTRGFSYGQSKDVWCRRCHSKLSVYAEQCKFVQHQPRGIPNQALTEAPKRTKVKVKEPVLKLGTPLPDYGTCQHYKKSHRWLRFPCCGKAYACDICHDSKEDHPMERANRMICGYCSQEQVYTTSKPCTLCGYDLAAVKHSAYWEGGQGCRNKTKMSRNDKHKYSQSTKKTTSKHLERVGVQGKKESK